jgi:capsular polysaccharide transport system ATP-binding protein
MLKVSGLAKSYPGAHGQRGLFDDLSFEVAQSGRLAVMGRNGQGKSTLIKILGGVLAPTAGQVIWSMRPSWPLGFAGGFQGSLSGLDNIRFISRVYGRPVEEIIERAEDFAQLGEALTMPLKHYSSGMRARLAFGLSLAVEFDCYLIDEVIAVGDSLFRRKCEDELFGRRADRAFIIASHDTEFLRRTCDRAIIIESGRAKLFEDLETALEIYADLCAAEPEEAEPDEQLEFAPA